MASQIQKLMKISLLEILISSILAGTGTVLPATAQVGFTIDAGALSKQIADAISESKDRTGCVKNIMFQTDNYVKQRANVMVFNLNQEFESNFQEQMFYQSATCAGLTYGVWVFKSGEFTNKGDGGWINWAFSGNFKRDGDQGHHVTFSPL